MRSRSSLLPSLATAFAVALLLALAPGPASASVDCPCWDELPENAFLLCYDPGGTTTTNSFGYAPINPVAPFLPAFYQVTRFYCRVNGIFQWLHSTEEADDCRRHLWNSCFPSVKPPC